MSSENIEPSESTVISNDAYVESIKLEGFGESRSAPVILTPNNLSAHPAGTHVLISGRCEPNAKRVEVFDAGNSLGDAVVLGNRWFFYRVWGVPVHDRESLWLGWIGHGAGAMLLFAEQTLENGNSDKSAVRLLTVGTMKKTPPPRISAGRDAKAHHVVLIGSCEPDAEIDITADGLRVLQTFAEHDGLWGASCYAINYGVSTFVAHQTGKGFLRSDASNSIEVEVSRIDVDAQENSSPEDSTIDLATSTRKPPAPTLDDPLGEGYALPEKYVLYSGTCEENANVEVSYDPEAFPGLIAPPRVFENKWYVQARPSSGAYLVNEVTIKVRQSVDGVYSDSNCAIYRAKLPAPLIEFPKTMTSHSADDFYLSGICNKDATIDVLNAINGQVLGPAIVKGTTWVSPEKWSKGSHHVIVRETWNGTRESEQIQFTIE